jgi:phosphocarrier protein
VQVASRYAGEVSVVGADGQSANAKSVMGVLLLCGSVGTSIEVQARGEAPNTVVDAIGRLIADRFGEPE